MDRIISLVALGDIKSAYSILIYQYSHCIIVEYSLFCKDPRHRLVFTPLNPEFESATSFDRN
jgi:hypothetical protein